MRRGTEGGQKLFGARTCFKVCVVTIVMGRDLKASCAVKSATAMDWEKEVGGGGLQVRRRGDAEKQRKNDVELRTCREWRRQ